MNKSNFLIILPVVVILAATVTVFSNERIVQAAVDNGDYLSAIVAQLQLIQAMSFATAISCFIISCFIGGWFK